MRMCKSYVVVGGWLDNQHITVNNNGMLKGPCHKMFGKLFPFRRFYVHAKQAKQLF